jgi:serine/threonine-protein kinase
MSGKGPLSADAVIGRVLLGRYRVVRELAKGGMGVVYLARAEGAVGFVKPVVIKLLLPEHAEDRRFVGMFVREAQILSQLRHPSVVDVLEFGEQDGAYVLVLEYVRGYHLGQWTRYLSLKKRTAPVEILIQIVIDVLDALHHAHNQVHPDGTPMQIVHRDVSPSNVLLDEDGRGRLLDFGVARMRSGAHDEKTQFKGFMGKLPYTAPEIFTGVEASPKSDLYACAVVLHELLLGRNVFRAENQAATMHRVMSHTPEPVEPARPDVPPGLDAMLTRALAKAPADRYPDARAFAAALRKLQREQESDVRARLADLLRADFGGEMAALLNLESLVERDEAWRRLSDRPQRAEPTPPEDEAKEESGSRTRVTRRPSSPERPRADGPRAPPAIGATVADAPSSRGARVATPVGVPSAAPVDGAPAARDADRPPIDARDRAEPVAQVAAANTATGTAAAEPASASAVQPRPTAAPNRAVLIGLGVVGALAIVAIALSLRSQAGSAAASPTPQIRVVATPTPRNAELQPAELAANAEPAALDPEPPAEAGSAGTTAKRDPRPRRTPAPSALTLTRAFRKQQPKLEACFKQHRAAAAALPRIQVEFDLDAAGKLTRVALIPGALASSPLGACLVQIARSTAFPAQGRPVSFAIPVTTSRGPDE